MAYCTIITLHMTWLLGQPSSLRGFQSKILWMSFLPMVFYQECGFWPSQLQEVIDNLILLPDNIVCQRTRVRATKSLAIFLMLRRWK